MSKEKHVHKEVDAEKPLWEYILEEMREAMIKSEWEEISKINKSYGNFCNRRIK